MDVPVKISSKLNARRGYIPVIGTINGHEFRQNLVPVKDNPYRLYVNAPMMKGGNVKVGDKAAFDISQDDLAPQKVAMPPLLKKRLEKEGLLEKFRQLIPSKQKEVNRYIANLKSTEAVERNVERVVLMLKAGEKSLW